MASRASTLVALVLLSGCEAGEGCSTDQTPQSRWCDSCEGAVGFPSGAVRLRPYPSEDPLCPENEITIYRDKEVLNDELLQKLDGQLNSFDPAHHQLVCYTLVKCAGNNWRADGVPWHASKPDTLVMVFDPPCQENCASGDTNCVPGFHLEVWMTPIADVVSCAERHLCNGPGPGPDI